MVDGVTDDRCRVGFLRVRDSCGHKDQEKESYHQTVDIKLFPVTPQKNYAKDQKHRSDTNECPVAVKEYRRDDHQQARKYPENTRGLF